MAETLKPCPFCGSSQVQVVQGLTRLSAWVACLDCLSSGPLFWGSPSQVESGAIAAWNRRAGEGLQETVEEHSR